MISSSGSHTAHLAGRQISQQRGVPWIADFGDPWSLIETDLFPRAWRARRNRALELRTVPFASGLVFATEATRQAYVEWLGDRLPPSAAMPCYGFDGRDFNRLSVGRARAAERLQLSHIGAAHRKNRNLIPTIRALRKLESGPPLLHGFQLNIIGPHSHSFHGEAAALIDTPCCFSDRVAYAESLDAIRRSHVLLLVGNPGPLQAPGKIYPYLGSGLPILYLGQRAQTTDPSYQMLREEPGVVFAENSSASIGAALERLDRDYSKIEREAARRREPGMLGQYESRTVQKKFAAFVVDRLDASRRRGRAA